MNVDHRYTGYNVEGENSMSSTIKFSKLKRSAGQLKRIAQRNKYTVSGEKTKYDQVNLEWVSNHNLGDELAPVIYNWMLEKKKIKKEAKINHTVHLMTVGSMIGSWDFDAVIWGSGIHLFSNINRLFLLKSLQKLDVRAVRGPITRNALKSCGHECPEVYGDPAILMPLIYCPKKIEKKNRVSIVLHYHAEQKWLLELEHQSQMKYLNIGTDNYEQYICEMLSAEKIISSSLHGIILAETYGIPAVFLNTGGYVDQALMKYYDWYYSTNRYNVKMARTVEEAIKMTPMPLPDLKIMQNNLLNSFPYDLWNLQTKDRMLGNKRGKKG